MLLDALGTFGCNNQIGVDRAGREAGATPRSYRTTSDPKMRAQSSRALGIYQKMESALGGMGAILCVRPSRGALGTLGRPHTKYDF